ncbi:MAG: hypothetical protein HYR84_02065 [Planctomycetes bacterium]|nr:hypothetical protein [Planctomycetota bacterium]
MIRAVVRNGSIQPLEPFPASCTDGRELVVDVPQQAPMHGTDDLDEWSTDMKALTATLNDAAEWQEIEAALAEADRQAKSRVRREMGLP